MCLWASACVAALLTVCICVQHKKGHTNWLWTTPLQTQICSGATLRWNCNLATEAASWNFHLAARVREFHSCGPVLAALWSEPKHAPVFARERSFSGGACVKLCVAAKLQLDYLMAVKSVSWRRNLSSCARAGLAEKLQLTAARPLALPIAFACMLRSFVSARLARSSRRSKWATYKHTSFCSQTLPSVAFCAPLASSHCGLL